jgi:hypothetical protein
VFVKSKTPLNPAFSFTKKSSFKLQKDQKYFLSGVHFPANATLIGGTKKSTCLIHKQWIFPALNCENGKIFSSTA